ncbi:MAG: condensation domain-containing protein, partial [Perlucidibaca sp.]
MRATPFNLLDQAFLNLDSPQEPWSVQLDMRVAGQVDPARLTQAFRAAMQSHPMTRGCLRPVSGYDTGYTWDIPDEVAQLPLEVVDVSGEGDLAQARARLQSHMVRLESSPPFAAMLARHPEGDYVMLNLSHVVGDGLSAFRLMTSVARHYAGEPDPVPDFDPLEKRDLTRLAGSRGFIERMRRLSLLIEHLWNSRTSPVRIRTRHAQDGAASDLPGYGFVTLELSPTEAGQVMARREKPATINDMLLAGLILAIAEWNRREGGEQGRVSIMMPVNLRPKAW